MDANTQSGFRGRSVRLWLGWLCILPVLNVPVRASAEAAAESAKSGNMALIYCAVAVLSVLLAAAYIIWEKRKSKYFSALYLCVAVANCGYFLQAVSPSLDAALWANRISYLGCAYLILLMLLSVMDVCQLQPGRGLRGILTGVSTAAFCLAAAGDWRGLYYKAAAIETVNGMTRLVKEYGPLHFLYCVYLLSYFAAMVAVILWAAKKKKLTSPKYAAFLASAVVLNIGVWAVEQVVDTDFEFLCVSYIATEIMLLLIYGILQDYGIVQPGGALLSVEMLAQLRTREQPAAALPPSMEALFSGFAERVSGLSAAERRILNYYMEGREPAQIPDLAFISIHTVKKHNRSIYQKLQVASRDELMLYIELFRCCGRLQELTADCGETE